MSIWSAVREAVAKEYAPTFLNLSAPALSTLSAPAPWLYDALGARGSATGQRVTPDTSMRVSAVYGCVAVLSQSVGQLPAFLMKTTPEGGSVPADSHPLYPILLHGFNDEMSAQEGFELAMNHLCLRGRAYFQIVRNEVGQVLQLWPLHPDFVVMRRNASGNLVYDYNAPGSEKTTYPKEQVWRIIGHTVDGITGISPISYARESIGVAMATEEHAAKLFANGAQIATAFEHPATLSEEGYKRLQASLDARFAGSANAFKTVLLEEGMKVSKLSLSSVESQFIEARKFQLEEICRIFRVPPHKVQDLARATFNNIEHLSMDFVNSSLMPYLKRFEETVYRDLLLPKERNRYFLRFDADTLMRGDMQARANYYASGITNRWLNPNEARLGEYRNPYAGGDKYENPNTSSNAAGDKPGAPVPDPKG